MYLILNQYLENSFACRESDGRLSLCCGILMNLCVCEPDAVSQGDVFPALVAFLARLITQGMYLINPL